MRFLLNTLAATALLAEPAASQPHATVLDLRPVTAGVSYARGRTAQRMFGVEVGIGVPQLEQRLSPRGSEYHDFVEFLHVALFTRFAPSERFETDLGLRVSAADLFVCRVSDCWPGAFGGAYGSIFYGKRRWKVGTMLEAGRISEPGEGTRTVVNVSPLLLRIKF